jgi:EmrB/QacA subfamily drug resistance transporter
MIIPLEYPAVSTPGASEERIHPNLILAVVSLAGLAYSMLSSAVIPALTPLQHSLHTNETGVTWLLTGYLLSASVGTAILGRLGDMYGKERLLLVTLVMLAFGTLISALATSLGLMIVGRVIQGAGGGIFPLAFGIVRDEFPRDRVAGSIGLLSSILGVGGGVGIVLGGVIVEHLNYHWLFWIPLVFSVIAVFATWRFVPESPVRVPGRVNWLAAALMTLGFSCVLVAISETITWGWGSARTLGLLAVGLIGCLAWIAVEARSHEPLIDMTMMRIRGVWTTNLVAFLLGAGMYASFLVFPQFAQLPKSTGFGFGASVVKSGLYLLPSAVLMTLLGTFAGRIARRFGSKLALIVGSGVTAVAFGWLVVAHGHPYDLMISAGLLGIGIGLAFSALGNLIVQAVPPEQTGAATGMNTVMRTLGGALGGQVVATLIANNVAHGLPTVTGFTEAFGLEAACLAVAVIAGTLVPAAVAARRPKPDISRDSGPGLGIGGAPEPEFVREAG